MNDNVYNKELNMEKNALVIQSLLLLPLCSSSFTFSMQKKTPLQRQQEKKQNQRGKNKRQVIKPQPQPQAHIQPQHIKPQPTIQSQNPSFPKVAYRDIVKKSLMQAKANNNQPSIITEEEEIERFVTTEETPLTFNEQTADVKEKVLEELKASFLIKTTVEHNNNEYHPIHTNPVDLTIVPEAAQIIGDSYSLEPYINYNEFPFLPLEQPGTETVKSIAPELMPSVILPTNKQGLGFIGNIQYYTNPITTIIAHLEKKTFDITNASYFGLLEKAIENAIADNDLYSLATITALCQKEEYKNNIRISDALTEKTLKLYTTSISLANNKLEEKLAEYNTKTAAFEKLLQNIKAKYENDMLALIDKYGEEKKQTNEYIAGMKKQLLTLSALNASIRKEAIQINIAKNHLDVSNECEQQFEVAKVSLTTLDKVSTTMPRIKEPKLALIQNYIEKK